MKRIISVLAVAALMAVMLAAMAAPAFAQAGPQQQQAQQQALRQALLHFRVVPELLAREAKDHPNSAYGINTAIGHIPPTAGHGLSNR